MLFSEQFKEHFELEHQNCADCVSWTQEKGSGLKKKVKS